MFSLFNGQKSKPGEKPYMPKDRPSAALQNVVYHYSPKFGRGLLLREKVRSCIFTCVAIKSRFTKVNLFDSYVIR
jgi:hypothetical protein